MQRRGGAGVFLQRGAVGGFRLDQALGARLALGQREQRDAQIVLRGRPVERHRSAVAAGERSAEGGDGLFKPRGTLVALAEPQKRVADVVLRRRPVEVVALALEHGERVAEDEKRLLEAFRTGLALAQRLQHDGHVIAGDGAVEGGLVVGQQAQDRTIGVDGLAQRAAVAGRGTVGVKGLGLEVLVVPGQPLVPLLDQIEGLRVVVRGGVVVEGEGGGGGALGVDGGVGDALLLHRFLGRVDGAAGGFDPDDGVVEEGAGGDDGALFDGALGGARQSGDLGIVGAQRVALGDEAAQPAGLG